MNNCLTAGGSPGFLAELMDLMKTGPTLLRVQEALQTQVHQPERVTQEKPVETNRD